MATDAELRDRAVAELQLTTAGWRKPNGQPNYPSGEAPLTTHWGKAMAVLEQIGGGAPEPPDPTVPAPIAGLGYSLVFEEDFDGPIDTSKWRFGYGKTAESPANFKVANSVLTITNKAAEKKQRDLQTKFGTQYGYFETKMRYTQDTSAWASLWMMGKSWLDTGVAPPYCCEFDIFEAFQSEPGSTWRSHSSTLHRNTTSPGGLADAITPNWVQDCGYDLGWNWVVYSGLWTPTTCSTYVNGKKIREWPTWGTSDQPMYTMLGIWSHDYSKDVQAEFDWFRIWQK